MPNDMTINDISVVVNDIMKAATGLTEDYPVTDTSSFVTVAQTALKNGFDPVMNAISQVLSRTVFTERPYSRALRGIEVSDVEWGNHVRKISFADKGFQPNGAYIDEAITDGQSVDMYKVNKPKTIQTNYYGYDTWEYSMTTYTDQLRSAFRNPEEFAAFWSAALLHANNEVEAAVENIVRNTLCNFIAGKVACDSRSVIDVALEPEQGVSTLDNNKNLALYINSRFKLFSDMMTTRSANFHQNFEGFTFMRHTPKSAQRIYIASPFYNSITNYAYAQTYHDDYLKNAYTESVPYWQYNDGTEFGGAGINVAPVHTDTSGAIVTVPKADAQQLSVVGCIIDKDAVGVNIHNKRVLTTPVNARGEYYNTYWKFDYRFYNDFTENGVIFTLGAGA